MSVVQFQELQKRNNIKDLRKYTSIAVKHRHPWLCLTLEIVYRNFRDYKQEIVLKEMKRVMNIYKGQSFGRWWKRIQSLEYSEFALKWGERYDRVSLVYLIRIYLKLVESALKSKSMELLKELDILEVNVAQVWIIFGNDDSMFVEYLIQRLEIENYSESLDCLHQTRVFRQMNHFYKVIGYDGNLVIDLLMSNETEFLEFYLKYLIKALKESQDFITSMAGSRSKIYDMLKGVCKGLKVLKDIIVFSTVPLVRRIDMVLTMMEKFQN